MRPAGACREVRSPEELGDHGIRRHADPRVQLQHAGASARVRGSLGLREVYRYTPDTAIHSH